MTKSIQKSLLLVGPGKHFGRDIIRKFSSEGWKIGVISQNQDKLDELESFLSTEGISIVPHSADVKSLSDMKNAIQKISEDISTFSCVIFNVKMSIAGSCLTINPEEFTDALTSNVTGAINTIQSVKPFLGSNASIIFTGGGYKDQPDPEKLALSVSKAALHNVYLAAKQTLRNEGISVKTVVIDGVVRENGPLYPQDVANLFWNAHHDEKEDLFVLK